MVAVAASLPVPSPVPVRTEPVRAETEIVRAVSTDTVMTLLKGKRIMFTIIYFNLFLIISSHLLLYTTHPDY